MDAGSPSMSLAELLPGASALPDALVRILDQRAAVHDVAAGTVLLRRRAVVADLIVLVSGRIATLVDFPGIGELVVETTEEPGRVFGWSGLHALGRATATIRADTGCRIVTVPLAPVLDGPPRWTAALCGMVAGALADRTQDLQVQRPGAVAREASGDA
jgi:CRP-like cAMP-binding protein